MNAIDPSLKLPDAADEIFARLIASGKVTKYQAYRDAYNRHATLDISANVQAARKLKKHWIHDRVQWLKENQVDQDSAKSGAQARGVSWESTIWEIVSTGSPSERLAAAKQLRDLERERKEEAEQNVQSDPAVILGHAMRLAQWSDKMQPEERKAFIIRLLQCLGSFGFKLAELSEVIEGMRNPS